MRSVAKCVKVPNLLLDLIPLRVAQLRAELGDISANAYIVSLIRADLANPAPSSSSVFTANQFSLWAQDKIDEGIAARWQGGELMKEAA